MITWAKNYFGSALTYFRESPAAALKAFMVLVLFQFSLLSFAAITVPHHTALPVLREIMTTAEYWWGLLSLFGALALLFEYHIRSWVMGQALGYGAALASFCALVYDFAFHKPPIFTGIVLAVTSALFLGGLTYDRFWHR